MSFEAILEQRPAPAVTAGLHGLPHTELRNRYHDLLALAPATLAERARRELLAEGLLPHDQRREAVYRRLCAWLDLDSEDARIIANAYDRAGATLPETLARRRMEDERDAMVNGLTFDEFRRLADILPWLDSDDGLALMAAAIADAEFFVSA